MNRTLAHPGFALLLLVGAGCAHPDPTDRVQSSVAEPTEPASTTAEPVPPAETRSPVEIAVAADLSSRGITATPTLAETVDVDGDGSSDSIFHAGTDVGCVLARTSGDAVRVDVLPAPLGTAPGLTRCGPALPLPTGALLVVFADNGMAQMRQGVLQLFAVAPGGDPQLVFQEMSPFAARYTLRVVDPRGIEVVAAGADPALVPGEIRKFLRLDASGTWVSASCWSEQAAAFVADEATCSVEVPSSARERRVESQAPGPPVFAGPAQALFAGAPPRSARAPRTWCVRFGGHTAWVELPHAVTARCPANLGSPVTP